MKLSSKQIEALEPSSARCVTAGAGAGKTKVLVEKYIHLLEQGASVERILALTFTEKAAAEMKERTRKYIWDKQGEKWKSLRDEFNWCQISTFHSFCARIIREYPFESGVSPGFGVLEDMQVEELKNEAFEQLLTLEKGDPLTSTMVSVLSETSERYLKEALWLMFKQRSELRNFLDSFRDPQELVKIWRKLSEDLANRTSEFFADNEKFMDSVETLASLAHHYASDRDAACRYLAVAAGNLEIIRSTKDPSMMCAGLCGLSTIKGSRSMGSAKVFSGKDLDSLRIAYNVVRTMLDNCPMETLIIDEDDDLKRAADLTCALKDIYERFNDTIQEQKSNANVLDFDDLVQIVHHMLSDHETFADKLSARYQHMLVDEFQDTDRAQSEIIWRITGKSPSVNRLFIVGDPKQSIYQFRNVDVSMFKLAQHRIRTELKGASTHLDINFRSTPQVIGVVNQIFQLLMPASTKDFEFQFERMGHCELRERDEGSVELLIKMNGNEERIDEAALVARRIRKIVEDGKLMVYWDNKGDHIEGGRKPCFGDVAILFRSRTHLKLYERRLKQLSIPYHIHSGLGFFQSQEIIDILNILRFLSNRGDDVSLYAALRSPYFAFSDDELFLICNSGGGQLYSRLTRCAEDGNERARAATMLLEKWLEIARRIPLHELLRRISLQSGIFAIYGALQNGAQMIANLEKLWRKALVSDNDGFVSLDDFIEWLASNAEEEESEGEAQLDTSQGDVVHIMTVHAAKGLEFPIVFVPELSSKLKSDSGQISFDPNRGIGISIPDPNEGYELRPSSVKVLIDAEAKERQIAERKRLLYVAMTRAKDHLVLSGEPPSDKPREMWMDWIWKSLNLTADDVAQGFKSLNEGLKLNLTTSVSLTETVSDKPPSATDIDEIAKSIIPMKRLPGGVIKIVLTPSMIKAYRQNASGFMRHYILGIPEVRVEGFGAISPEKLGTALHEVFRGIEPEVALSDFGMDEESQVKRLIVLRDRFLEIDEIKNAKRHLTEIPVMGRIGTETVTGTIDRLVFSSDRKYSLLDYKTDKVPKDCEEVVAREYEQQLAIYSLLLEPLIGRPEQSKLYFVSNNQFFEIGKCPSSLTDEIDEVVGKIRELR